MEAPRQDGSRVLEAYSAAPGCSPTRRYSTDSRGISVGGVVGGVFGCLLAIVGAVILYKTWRVLEVKRVGRNRKELVMLGGGMAARAQPLRYHGFLRRRPHAAALGRAGAAATAATGAAMAFVGLEVAMEVFQVRA